MSSDNYRIDGHKLHLHVHRVADWLDGRTIYPVYMEISPTGRCNHRCVFCSVDFMAYRKRQLDAGVLKVRLAELGRLGLKSVMYAGEGEPFLHRGLADIIGHTHDCGIDVAVTTNGVLMTPDVATRILGATRWIKVSCNAGSAKTYARIHQTAARDFDRVIGHLTAAVAIRQAHGHRCTLGLQLLLLPENAAEVETLAETARDIGLDYLVVKPYTHHSRNRHRLEIHYQEFASLAESLSRYDSDTFKVIFRAHTMQKWDAGHRSYQRCLALPFWSYIDAGGNVWGCSAHLGDERFKLGNIQDQTFQAIWEGTARRQLLAWVQSALDLGTCKLNCRMDEINRYLWELRHPSDHVNFI